MEMQRHDRIRMVKPVQVVTSPSNPVTPGLEGTIICRVTVNARRDPTEAFEVKWDNGSRTTICPFYGDEVELISGPTQMYEDVMRCRRTHLAGCPCMLDTELRLYRLELSGRWET